jgi:leucyl-tRNA synthetase
MEYKFRDIEPRWQAEWQKRGTYRVEVDPARPKYYVLDMFPYPSGAGLHVGHPLGYIASDIYTRYKRLGGFNVLHPMGFDAFGLPAEQYAIQTGQHPAKTTADNIARYREQLDKLGFSYDWSRCVETCDPAYYKWTQWAFLQMFNSYYCFDSNRARPISELEENFPIYGNEGLNAACTTELHFTAAEWNAMSESKRADVLMNYRLAYRASTMVNWCEALGTVLANDEVKDGLSERGGHPVVQKQMQQWLLRVSAYAERLLSGLDELAWSDSLKEIQRNWIGKSVGAQMFFDIGGNGHGELSGESGNGHDCDDKGGANGPLRLEIFTTRPDTIYGVTFMVLAPEHALVERLTTAEQRGAVADYIAATKKRSERERIADTKKVSGVFTGAYAKNPFTGETIPIYISDYVLAGYGTGAIMAVPAHDDRDKAFAEKFNLPVVHVVEGKDQAAIDRVLAEIESRGIGSRKVNYRLRDAIFSRQRYWGEPIPVYYKNGVPTAMPVERLPLELPAVADFSPSPTGEPPLARVEGWSYTDADGTWPLETSTMPGFAGSSAYYLRYMDPTNGNALVSQEADEYWLDVDLYIGGIEHATGHLIYSRFWDKFLFDTGAVTVQEPFKKLVNQGMIQGRSNFVYRDKSSGRFVSLGLIEGRDVQEIHVDVNIVRGDVLDIDAFRRWRPEFANAEFDLEDGKYICGWAVEKMSKSMYNVVNPDKIVEDYGADTLRMYEMFLGPLEQSKPWDTNGIDGVHRFLKKFWGLFWKGDNFAVTDDTPTPKELKALHRAIKKVREDIENFSFNTAVSTFMICLNDLGPSNKRAVLEPLAILLAPFAPHITEELWAKMGHTETIFNATMPEHNPAYLVEVEVEYPVSVNGKLRFKRTLPVGLTRAEIESTILADAEAQKWIATGTLKKVIVVPEKIVNIVIE